MHCQQIEQRGDFFLDINDQASLVELATQVITLTGELSNAQINLEGQLKEASKYSPDNSGAGGSTPGGGNGEEENPLG